MNREELLKNSMISKYGSVLKFAHQTGIPYTTIRNIFTRGLDSINAGTLVKICNALSIDIESLMDGTLSVRPNSQKDAAWDLYTDLHNFSAKNKTLASDDSDTREISLEDSTALLSALGYIEPGGQLSDEDLAFLTHIIGMLDSWFSKKA